MNTNLRAIYRVSCVNGRFGYIATKRAAIVRAAEIAGAPEGTREGELARDWGISIERCTAAIARSIAVQS